MNKSYFITIGIASGIFLMLQIGPASAQQQFQGSVWEGSVVHTYTTPLCGDTVALYGSSSATSIGTRLDMTTTNSNGQYGLDIPRIPYNYYNIIETTPGGYTAVGATSVSGTVISADQIQYAYPLTGKTLTGNKFWNERQSSQTSNRPPIAEANGPYTFYVGVAQDFTGVGSYDPDAGDSIIRYEWDLNNDGTFDEIGMTWSKTYTAAGSGTVVLRVTDSHGEQDTDTATYTVYEETHNTGAIYGMKFDDQNKNAINDSEPGLPGWTIMVQITFKNEPSSPSSVYTLPFIGYIITDKDGKFSLPDAPAGDYELWEVLQSGWTQTCPPSPGKYKFSLADGEVVKNIDFGNSRGTPDGRFDYGDAPSPYPEASNELGGYYLGKNPPDAEGGMQRDTNAQGDDNNGTDDEDGIEFQGGSIPRGGIGLARFGFTAPVAAGGILNWCLWIDFNQDKDWDDPDEEVYHVYYKNNSASPLSLTAFSPYMPLINVPGTAKTGITFARVRIGEGSAIYPSGPGGPGEVEDYKVEIRDGGTPAPPGGITCGRKFDDLDGNGAYDTGEPGLPNWSIWLDTNGNETYDAGVDRITETDAAGVYCFTGLADGTYLVGEIPQPGWVQTCPIGPIKTSVTISAGRCSVLPLEFGNHRINPPPGGGKGASKWSQPPLRHPDNLEHKCYYGWSELAMDGNVTIADDWYCYSPRPVTSITWWGAYAGWKGSGAPEGAPQKFHLGVWSDVPRTNDKNWSHPGKMIRSWVVDRPQLNETSDLGHQMPEWMPQPDSCFKYTYTIPEAQWFHQPGDSTVYWLSIAALYTEPPKDHVWGWLTREHYFNDNPVRILKPVELFPDSLFGFGESLPDNWDMAFVLGTDQDAGTFDFGDATDELNTTIAHNGALHLIRNDVHLGQSIDAEDNGQPDPLARGDDSNGVADEDGVVFLSTLAQGKIAKAAVSTSKSGYLNGWLDLNANGRWEPREHILNNLNLPAGNHILDFPVADDARSGLTIIRFRFSTWPNLWVKGFAADGEVEDYQVEIQKATKVDAGKTGELPDQFKLYPNYPNPFNPSTTIRFDLVKPTHVRLSIHNLVGQGIVVLLDENCTAGTHEVRWDGCDALHQLMPTGVYLFKIEADPYHRIGKLLLLK